MGILKYKKACEYYTKSLGIQSTAWVGGSVFHAVRLLGAMWAGKGYLSDMQRDHRRLKWNQDGRLSSADAGTEPTNGK